MNLLLPPRAVFYPRWWLDAVGYFTHPPNKDPKAILFAPNPTTVADQSISLTVAMMVCLFTALAFSSFGYQYAKFKFHRSGYETLGTRDGVGQVGDGNL
jgi:hypothetical protein